MDIFKALQRRSCPSPSPNKPHWGCPCCVDFSAKTLKRKLRKLTKTRLKAFDRAHRENETQMD